MTAARADRTAARRYRLPTWRRIKDAVLTLSGLGLLAHEAWDRGQPIRVWIITAALALIGVPPAAMLDDWIRSHAAPKEDPEQ